MSAGPATFWPPQLADWYGQRLLLWPEAFDVRDAVEVGVVACEIGESALTHERYYQGIVTEESGFLAYEGRCTKMAWRNG